MTQVALIYRKPHPGGSFSIEASFDASLQHFAGAGAAVRKVVSPFPSRGLLPRIGNLAAAARIRADVFHITGDVHYLAYALPRARTVLTIHDCGFVRQGSKLRGLTLRELWLRGPVRRCARITAISGSTKREIVDCTGCDPDRIAVIPTVVSDRFRRIPGQRNRERPRILHIGMKPNKNFERHVAALEGIDCELQIVGRLSRADQAILERHRVAYSAEENVSDARIVELYGQCDLLLFASTFEGFGMPIVEAQRVGRPVVTSRASSMPEVAGDAACLVDPFDVRDIRAGVLRVLGDDAYRESLVAQGFRNAERFRPESVARAYASLYEGVLAAATTARRKAGSGQVQC